MCGICGFVTSEMQQLTEEESRKRWRAFAGLLAAMSARGTDSTGVALYDTEHNQIRTLKCRCLASPTFIQRDYFDAIGEKQHNLAIGHTRLATTGDVTRRNAHPFRIGSVCGAHNGGIRNWATKADDLDIDDIEVDSEIIFHLLHKHDAPEQAFKEISGSAAISWYDESTNMFGLARNTNPIHVAYVEEIDTMFWASHEKALLSSLSSAGYDIQWIDVDKEEMLLVFPDAKDGLSVVKNDIEFTRYTSYTGTTTHYGTKGRTGGSRTAYGYGSDGGDEEEEEREMSAEEKAMLAFYGDQAAYEESPSHTQMGLQTWGIQHSDWLCEICGGVSEDKEVGWSEIYQEYLCDECYATAEMERQLFESSGDRKTFELVDEVFEAARRRVEDGEGIRPICAFGDGEWSCDAPAIVDVRRKWSGEDENDTEEFWREGPVCKDHLDNIIENALDYEAQEIL